jgi:3-oxoadipate enol-lactonase
MNTQIAANCTVAYDDVGQGKPLVLLHAFPLARGMWRAQVDSLKSTCRCLVPDLRGFGGTSGFQGTPSIEQMADDVHALLDQLHVEEPITLGGLSMGGYVALAFARKHAARLQALILADTRAEADTPEGKANRDKMIAFAQTHSAADVIEQMLPNMVSDETRENEPEVVEEIRRLASQQTTAGIIAALAALRDRSDATPTLGQIRVPTLVLVGRDDKLTPPALAQNLVNGIRGAKLATIPAAGHLSNMEQPDIFNDALRSFLRGLP